MHENITYTRCNTITAVQRRKRKEEKKGKKQRAIVDSVLYYKDIYDRSIRVGR